MIVEKSFMQQAIEEAREGIRNHHGGPFGSVIVKDGIVVGKGHNRVLQKHDATCHGEMEAIRDASARLGTHDLTGCTLYTTGEPCQMCLCACLWAKIDKVYYGCTIAENALIGFRDEWMDTRFSGREKLGDYLQPCGQADCQRLFTEYQSMEHTLY